MTKETNVITCFHCEWIGTKFELLTGPNGIKCPDCKKHIPQDAEGWISVQNGKPETVGWYDVKTLHGESEVPFANRADGKLVWVLPDPSIITHWKYQNQKQ